MDWAQLLERVRYIRELYAMRRLKLLPGEGLGQALMEAEALGLGQKLTLQEEPSEATLLASAHAAHVVWALADGLKQCDDAGLDLTAHLKQITTGTTDFGTPATGNDRTHFGVSRSFWSMGSCRFPDPALAGEAPL